MALCAGTVLIGVEILCRIENCDLAREEGRLLDAIDVSEAATFLERIEHGGVRGVSDRYALEHDVDPGVLASELVDVVPVGMRVEDSDEEARADGSRRLGWVDGTFEENDKCLASISLETGEDPATLVILAACSGG